MAFFALISNIKLNTISQVNNQSTFSYETTSFVFFLYFSSFHFLTISYPTLYALIVIRSLIFAIGVAMNATRITAKQKKIN